MIVVSDTTPIISLLKINKLSILEALFHEVQIPAAVFAELTTAQRYQNEAEIIRNCPFLRVVVVKDRDSVERMRRNRELDLGESEAIILTEAISADLLIVDEAAARDVARSLNIRITGTIGLLMEAYERGLLSANDIINCVNGLRNSNRHISEKYYQKLLDLTTRK